MDKIELETLLVNIKKMLPTLERAYRLLSDEEIENKLGSIHIPCDSCDEKDCKIN